MKKKHVLVILLALIILTVAGCGKSVDNTPASTAILTVDITHGADGAKTVKKSSEFTDIKNGDIIYEGFGTTITVKKVSADHISFITGGGLIEPNEDGTLNLGDPSVRKFTMNPGEELTLHTRTMDAGDRITIRYLTETDVK